VSVEKFTVAQVVKKLPHFMELGSFFYLFLEITPLVPILGQMNEDHKFPFYFFKQNFNFIPLSMAWSYTELLLSGFYTENILLHNFINKIKT
jgi:hypothetical protein